MKDNPDFPVKLIVSALKTKQELEMRIQVPQSIWRRELKNETL